MRNMRKYRQFKRWKKRQYKKFLRKSNFEFDWGSWVKLNILKLTMMGLQVAKFGVCVDEERIPQVRQIWAARRELKHVVNAFEITEAAAQKKFKERFGCEYVYSLPTLGDVRSSMTPEMREYWKELAFTKDGQSSIRLTSEAYQSEALHNALAIIEKWLFSWWD